MSDKKELLKAVWSKAKCGDLVAGQNIISIDSEVSIEEACAVLSKHKILSAPIWSKTHQMYIGLFDVADMIAFLLAVFQTAPGERKTDLKTVVQEGIRKMPVPVKWVADLSLRNPLKMVPASDPLSTAVSIFATGIRRVCVAGSDGRIQGVLTQSAVARWLENTAMAEVEPIVQKTLAEMGMVGREVLSVETREPLVHAIEIMHDKKVSSVAMLNTEKCLVGSVSLSDIKYMFHAMEFEWLWRPVHAFVSAVRIGQAFDNEGKDSAPVFGVRATSTLSYAMMKMRATKAHRVWIVSEDGDVPIGVVSLTDVMKALDPES